MSFSNTRFGFSTDAIHFGYDPLNEQGALTPPLHLTSTFAFGSASDAADAFAGENSAHFYTRISNPTNDLLERRIAHLEGAEAGVATASGMGAITSVLWTFLKPGDELIVDKTLYGCTFSFLRDGLSKFGVVVTAIDLTNPENLERAISKSTRIIYFETPANPNMRLVDISAICAIASAAGIRTVIDATYSTPLITRPIELGADIVVHSATKYLGGHGDLVAGIAVGSEEDMRLVRLEGMKDMTGACASPFNSMLILRGLKTLTLRMRQHNQGAMAIAKFLEEHPSVSNVLYPGLASHPQFELAQKQMQLPGGIIAFELKNGFNGGIEFMDRLSLVARAVSLGDAETLVQHPASMTHSTYTPEERAVYGISDGLLRLSVGLEDESDLINDLEMALS